MNKGKVQNIIIQCYEDDTDIVNHRTALLAKVWRIYGWSDSRTLEYNLEHLSSAETVSRCLRSLHEAGVIKYSDEELKRRDNAFKSEQAEHSTHIVTPAKAVSWLDD